MKYGPNMESSHGLFVQLVQLVHMDKNLYIIFLILIFIYFFYSKNVINNPTIFWGNLIFAEYWLRAPWPPRQILPKKVHCFGEKCSFIPKIRLFGHFHPKSSLWAILDHFLVLTPKQIHSHLRENFFFFFLQKLFNKNIINPTCDL